MGMWGYALSLYSFVPKCTVRPQVLVEGANAALLDIDFGILLASFFCLEVPGNLSSFLAFVAMKPSFFLCVLFLLDSSAFSAILRLEDLAGFTALQGLAAVAARFLVPTQWCC